MRDRCADVAGCECNIPQYDVLPDTSVWTDYQGDTVTVDYTVPDCAVTGNNAVDQTHYNPGMGEVALVTMSGRGPAGFCT